MRGRVVGVERGHYEVLVDNLVQKATVRGSFHEQPATALPKVGDYVSVQQSGVDSWVITAVEPRQNEIIRRLSFDDSDQVLVTNVDYLAIVMGCDNDFNIRRLERYLALAETAGVTPVIVLTKVDLVEDVATYEAAIRDACPDCVLFTTSTKTKTGIAQLQALLTAPVTIVLLGSSGAGKSSLTNALLATTAATGAVRTRDDRGRHTTRKRQMYVLANGAAVIDTPGIRELAMTDETAAAAAAFPQIEALANECRFSNCDHEQSAGCAIQAAVASGTIDATDVAAYLRLRTRQQRHRRTRSHRRRR